MTRTMYDAIDVANLPIGGDLYAGYDDGSWPDADAIAARFPGREVLRITVSPTDNQGVIGDGPPDNGTWQQWVAWVKMRRAAGADPWINTNQNNNWQAGRDAFASAGVPEPHWWVANYDGDPTLPAGALMKQYASNDSYDTSSCAAYLPGIDPAPTPPAPAAPPVSQEDTMRQKIVYDEARRQQHFVYIADGWVYHRVYDETTGHESVGTRLPGAQVNPAAGVDAAIMMSGGQLHVFAEFLNTGAGTGAHYWLGLPVDPAKPQSWLSATI